MMKPRSVGREQEPYGPVEQRMDVADYNYRAEEEVKRYVLRAAGRWDERTKGKVREITEGHREDMVRLNSIRDDTRRQ